MTQAPTTSAGPTPDDAKDDEEVLVPAVAEPGPGAPSAPNETTDPDAPPPAEAAAAHPNTRERILDAALDLFTEQGFDGTSLRQIAEKLGVTKAALYYHFESKDDILLALHMRIHEFGKGALVRMMGDEPVTLELWGELLDGIVDQMLDQRKIFLMHERNQAALEKLHGEAHDAEHEDIQNQLRRVLADPRVPFPDRVKMAASVGVVFSGLFLSGDAFDEDTNEELGDQLRVILHNVLFG